MPTYLLIYPHSIKSYATQKFFKKNLESLFMLMQEHEKYWNQGIYKTMFQNLMLLISIDNFMKIHQFECIKEALLCY